MKASNNYPVPDVFRLCAALLVVMYHPSGQIRKTGFGLISGDIISIGVERASSGTEFFKNRFSRILPCLWLCSWIGAMLFFIFGLFPLPQIIQMYAHSALLLPSGPYVDGVIWTIMLELVIYLLVGLIIAVTAFRAIANARTKGEVLTAAMADDTSVAMRENFMLPVGLEPSKLMKRKVA